MNYLQSKYDKVIIASGHMIDGPTRDNPRFPNTKENTVSDQISQQLHDWHVGANDLAMCGGARGTDIIFAEQCLKRGANVWIHLALEEEEFLKESVSLPNSDWEVRFNALKKHPKVWRTIQKDKTHESPFVQANLHILQTAQKVADSKNDIYALLVWDEKKSGDGPGGTAEFCGYVQEANIRLSVINPLKLFDRLGRPNTRKLLSLDGGGIRGIITIEVLAKIEQLLQKQLNRNDSFVLADFFDYIGGTSTGAIIATCLSQGMRVNEIRDFYHSNGKAMFDRTSLLRRFRHKYEKEKLTKELKKVIGEHTKLGDESLKTFLLLVMRNATTDSPWPVSNNPTAKYNLRSRPDCNLMLPLWQLVRASTAAPIYFPPECINVGSKNYVFVDGGVTMYNNPAFQLFLMATLEPYNLQWNTGENKMLVVSVGTGAAAEANSNLLPNQMNLIYNATSIPSALMNAASIEQDLLCRVFGKCRYGEELDREVGNLCDIKGLLEEKLFTYVRYNANLSVSGLTDLGLKDIEPRNVQKMDSIKYMHDLERVGKASADKVHLNHFRLFT